MPSEQKEHWSKNKFPNTRLPTNEEIDAVILLIISDCQYRHGGQAQNCHISYCLQNHFGANLPLILKKDKNKPYWNAINNAAAGCLRLQKQGKIKRGHKYHFWEIVEEEKPKALKEGFLKRLIDKTVSRNIVQFIRHYIELIGIYKKPDRSQRKIIRAEGCTVYIKN